MHVNLCLCGRLSSRAYPDLGRQSHLGWASVDAGGEPVGSNLGGGGGAGQLAALGRISLSGWHQGELDNCSQINKSFLQNGLAG